MFKIKLFSFTTKDKSGSLFEVSMSPDRPVNAVSRRIGFTSAERQERRPKPRRSFTAISLFEGFFRSNDEEQS